MSDRLSKLDADQVIKRAGLNIGDDASPLGGGLSVINLGGSFVPDKFDRTGLTYVAAGNGIGEIETVTYYLDGNPIAVLTLSYDAQNRLIDVSRS